jgi:hypothetical protein
VLLVEINRMAEHFFAPWAVSLALADVRELRRQENEEDVSAFPQLMSIK